MPKDRNRTQESIEKGRNDLFRTRDADVQLLRKAGVADADVDHCLKVAQKAVEIAKRTGADLDMELVARGALLHDLGKAKTHGIEHGKIGAELGRELGLPRPSPLLWRSTSGAG